MRVLLPIGVPKVFGKPLNEKTSHAAEGDKNDHHSSCMNIAVDPTRQLLARIYRQNVDMYLVPLSKNTQYTSKESAIEDSQSTESLFLFSFARAALPEKPLKYDDEEAVWGVWIAGLRLVIMEKYQCLIEIYQFSVDHIENSTKLHVSVTPFAAMMISDYSTLSYVNRDLNTPLMPSNPTLYPLETENFLKLESHSVLAFELDFPAQVETTETHTDQNEAQDKFVEAGCCFSGPSGGTTLFIGLYSGSILGLQFSPHSNDPLFTAPKQWKLDLRSHISQSNSIKSLPCTNISSSFSSETKCLLVVSFADSQCFVLLIDPLNQRIYSTYSIVQNENHPSSPIRDSNKGFLSACAANAKENCLALGYSNSTFTLYTFHHKDSKHATPSLTSTSEIGLDFAAHHRLGPVSCLEWTRDASHIAVGYRNKGFAVYTRNGSSVFSNLFSQTLGDVHSHRDMCVPGTQLLLFAPFDTALLVFPHEYTEKNTHRADELMNQVQVDLFKDKDGLCLSLSGCVGKYGTYVQSDACFTRRQSNNGIGPAEATGNIFPGDLLTRVRYSFSYETMEDITLISETFERVISCLKEIPPHSQISLDLLRLDWEKVFILLQDAVRSPLFRKQQHIELLAEETPLLVREMSLRMQALYGDQNSDTLRVCEFIKSHEHLQIAGMEAYKALKGVSHSLAIQKYVKFIISLLPKWDIVQFINAIAKFSFSCTAPSPLFSIYPIVQNVPLNCGSQSQSFLLSGDQAFQLSVPSCVFSWRMEAIVRHRVPPSYLCNHKFPLRIAAASPDEQHIAVAGERGFCLCNRVSQKWRVFGDMQDEQDQFVTALLWLDDDVILTAMTRVRERFQNLYLQAFPRNHLDSSTLLSSLTLQPCKSAIVSMEKSEYDPIIYCFSKDSIYCVRYERTGELSDGSLTLSMVCTRILSLPSLFCGIHCNSMRVLPRLVHVQSRIQKSANFDDEKPWYSKLLHHFVSGQAPDQFDTQQALVRFACIDSETKRVLIWDPEARSICAVTENAQRFMEMNMNAATFPDWPASYSIIKLVHCEKSLKLWLPLLDGVLQFVSPKESQNLHAFLQCQDPVRAKTYELEFGTGDPTYELYDQVMMEYGISVPEKSAFEATKQENTESHLFTLTTLSLANGNDFSTGDDVEMMSVSPFFGVAFGVSQDIFLPLRKQLASEEMRTRWSENGQLNGVSIPIHDISVRIQPILHRVLGIAVQLGHWKEMRAMTVVVMREFPLAFAIMENFVMNMLEDVHEKRISSRVWEKLLACLQPSDTNDALLNVEQYCQLIGNLARKCDSPQLKWVFPGAGDPHTLLKKSLQIGNLQLAANYLLLLSDELCGREIGMHKRNVCAIDLLKAAMIHEKDWPLARDIVRVVRQWEAYGASSLHFVEETLAEMVLNDLRSEAFERCAFALEHLQAKFPANCRGAAEEKLNEKRERVVQRLCDTFIATKRARQLRYLSQALSEAGYVEWVTLIKECFVDVRT